MSTITTRERTPDMTSPANLDATAIGERIRLARMEAGMKQDDLAEKIGVIPRSIQNYENGRIPWRKLNEIAAALDRSKEWILYGGDDAEPVADSVEILRRLDELQATVQRIAEATGTPAPKRKRNG